MTFEMIQRHVNDVWLVKEETIRKAIYLLWIEEKQIVEGSGAAAIAPLLENEKAFAEKKIVAVITGGNIEEELLRTIVSSKGN